MKEETINKNQKKKEIEIDDKKKKPSISFIQVDKGGSLISNFISNFIRQFNNQQGHSLGLLKGLWQSKRQQSEKQAQPSNIIGSIQDDAKLAKERRERWSDIAKNTAPKNNVGQNKSVSKGSTEEIKRTAFGQKKPELKL